MQIKKKLITILLVLLMLVIPTSIFASTNKVDSDTLRTQINEYLIKIREDGTYEQLSAYWFDTKIANKTINYEELSGENGHLVMGTTTQEPFSYVHNNLRVGFTIDIIYRFCKEYGYSIEFEDYSSSSGVITAIQNGKCDFGGGNTSVTEERKGFMDFSDPFYENETVIITREEDANSYNDIYDFSNKTIGTVTGCSLPDRIHSVNNEVLIAEYNSIADACKALDNGLVDGVCYDKAVLALAQVNYPNLVVACNFGENDYFAYIFNKAQSDTNLSIIDKFKNSINRNFIEGQRYKLLLEGLVTTLNITILSILLGTALGFVVFMTTKKGNKIVALFSWIIDGLPGVVLLMILYYVVFGKLNVAGMVVSVIAFSLIFASNTHSLLRTAVGAIDRGQFEASSALGYTKNEAFFKMILPQALTLVWPGYKGAIVSQIKATAIVGYIAEQDLTKAGDMIRSSTFEAFFPLIVVAVQYFIIAWILTSIVDIIAKLVGPSRKKSERFLKEVNR